MSLLDILRGTQGGSAGEGAPSGGLPPIAMALIALMASKVVQGSGGQPTTGGGGPLGGLLQGVTGGRLGGLLQGGGGGVLGGLLGSGNAGGVLSAGLGDLVKQLQEAGHGEAVNSWVGNGENQAIAPDDIASALGPDKISALMAHSGLSRDDLLAGLAQHLPGFVNQLTPNGRLPTEAEAQAHVG